MHKRPYKQYISFTSLLISGQYKRREGRYNDFLLHYIAKF